MNLPLVAIIGRPNVGKSTLFNALVGKNMSIVSPESGTTRDRIIERVEWQGHAFNFVDTGGVDFNDDGAFNVHIKEQVDIAIDLADVVVFVTSGEGGVPNPTDHDIANMLRRYKKKIVLAVNKLDNRDRANETLSEFYRLKIGEPMAISCTQRMGLGDLLDAIIDNAYPDREKLPKSKKDRKAKDDIRQEVMSKEEEWPPKVAIIGRPNAGKSSIVNKLLGENRVMVSDHAGTTRDTIDCIIKHNGREYVLTDTAGIRRKRSIEVQTVEHYSVLRALAAIRRSDVVVLVVDAIEGLTEQDVRLIGYAHEEGKPSVVVINKWDLVEKDNHTMNEFGRKIAIDLAFMSYFKAIYISAKTGQRMGELMKAIESVLERAKTRITTGQLNTLLNGFIAVTPPPGHSGKRPKFLYYTQVGINPPTFALFVNDKTIIKTSYLRYLENSLRKSIDLTGTPIRFLLRNREDK